MAETLTFDLTDDAWTDVSTSAGTAGFITNGSDATILYTQAETPPAITSNAFHRLNPTDRINYSVTGAEVIYARSTQATGVLHLTPGQIS